MEEVQPKNNLGMSLQVKLLILIVALVFIGAAGVFGYYLGKINGDVTPVEFSRYEHQVVVSTTTIEDVVASTSTEETGYESPTTTWKYANLPTGILDAIQWTPKVKVSDLGIFKFELGKKGSREDIFMYISYNDQAQAVNSGVEYNEMGHFNFGGKTGKIFEVIEHFDCTMGCMYDAYYTAITYDNKIYLLKNLSQDFSSDKQVRKSVVLVDKNFDIAYLHFPKKVYGPKSRQVLSLLINEGPFNTIGKNVFGQESLSENDLGLNLKVMFTDNAWGKVYSKIDNYSGGDTWLGLNQFYISGKDGNIRTYQYTPDFSTSQIVWSNGAKNTDEYNYLERSGCGETLRADVVSSTLVVGKDLVIIGTNSKGDKIYALKDQNDPTLKEFYDNSYFPDPINGRISYEEFLKQRPMFFWHDPFGRLIRFKSTKFGPPVECGKPVIYLYPEKTTDVSVKIDLSRMTYSEPAYNGGWNVTAEPNGKLTDKSGNVYPYLFWEGIGVGEQKVQDKGFMVKRENIHSFLLEKLAKMGLNQKESADFIEYWEPKMQSAPYYFVTFYGTRDMNVIAPLTINPKPDTLIRILMDYRPLQQPIQVEELRLGTLERKGFTVIEWGGVLGR